MKIKFAPSARQTHYIGCLLVICLYISADAILHAWHRTFESILKEVEQEYLYDELIRILEETIDALSEAKPDERDAKIYLSVARELMNYRDNDHDHDDNGDDVENLQEKVLTPLEEKTEEDSLDQYLRKDIGLFQEKKQVGASETKDLAEEVLHTGGSEEQSKENGVEKAVFDLVEQVKRFQPEIVDFMGTSTEIDFSQFLPRGHYTDSDTLKQYFLAMTWLGQVDLVLYDKSQGIYRPREEAAARAILRALYESQTTDDQWKTMLEGKEIPLKPPFTRKYWDVDNETQYPPMSDRIKERKEERRARLNDLWG